MGQRQPGTSARWVPFLLWGEVGRERVCEFGAGQLFSGAGLGRLGLVVPVPWGRGLWGCGCASGCPCCFVPVLCAGEDPASLEGGTGWPGLGAVDVTAAMSVCRERGQQCPGMNVLPGTRGCWCHSPHHGRGGSRGGDGARGLCRRLLPPRAEGQRCQQWLQPEPGPPEVAGEQEHAGFMACLVMCLWLGWDGCGCCPALPWVTRAGPCSAYWC